MPETQRPPLSERLHNIAPGRVAAFMLATASVATLTGSEIAEPHYDFTACVQPSSDDFAAVDNLLATHAEQLPQQGSAARANVVLKYHFTVDQLGKPALHALNSAIAGDGPTLALPSKEYFSAARSAAHAYGMDFSISTQEAANPNDPILKHAKELNAEQLESKDAKRSLVSFLQMLSSLPTEFISWADIKSVQLIDLPDGVGGYIDTVNKPTTYYVDPTNDFNYDSFRHELWHKVDSKLCKSVFNDPAYTLLNPKRFTYKFINMISMPKRYSTYAASRPLEDQLSIAEALQDTATMQGIEAKLAALGKSVIAIDPYGATAVQEDKATVGAELLSIGPNTDYESLTGDHYPVLRAKIRLQLARLHAERPDLCEYLLSSINGTPY